MQLDDVPLNIFWTFCVNWEDMNKKCFWWYPVFRRSSAFCPRWCDALSSWFPCVGHLPSLWQTSGHCGQICCDHVYMGTLCHCADSFRRRNTDFMRSWSLPVHSHRLVQTNALFNRWKRMLLYYSLHIDTFQFLCNCISPETPSERSVVTQEVREYRLMGRTLMALHVNSTLQCVALCNEDKRCL